MASKVITNYRPKLLLDWNQLTPKEQADFDYLDTDDRRISASFFRYRGNCYDMGEFMHANELSFVEHYNELTHNKALKPNYWRGYLSDSFFSGVLVRYTTEDDYGDNDHIIVGTYLSLG